MMGEDSQPAKNLGGGVSEAPRSLLIPVAARKTKSPLRKATAFKIMGAEQRCLGFVSIDVHSWFKAQRIVVVIMVKKKFGCAITQKLGWPSR
jgi:hypothetical protein